MSTATIQEITHSCGHSGEHDLSTKAAGERAGYIRWLENKSVCIDCSKQKGQRELSKEFKAERDQKRQDALHDQGRSNLPILSGTEKQVTWATTVRYDFFRACYEAFVVEGELSEEEYGNQYLVPARLIGRAGWWIDNREANLEDLAELFADSGEEEAINENPF